MSEDGRITFVGRVKELINYGGFKVPPLKVENVLNTHTDVEEAQVCFLKYGRRCHMCMRRSAVLQRFSFVRWGLHLLYLFEVMPNIFGLHNQIFRNNLVLLVFYLECT